MGNGLMAIVAGLAAQVRPFCCPRSRAVAGGMGNSRCTRAISGCRCGCHARPSGCQSAWRADCAVHGQALHPQPERWTPQSVRRYDQF